MCGSHWLSCSNKKDTFPAVGEMTTWEILLMLHEKKKGDLKKNCSAFKSQGFVSLWHITHVFRHSQRRGIYFELLYADAFLLNTAEQRHHQFFCQPAGFFTKERSHKPIGHASHSRGPSLLKAATLFLCARRRLPT